MSTNIQCTSAYLCVKDMDRAILFYESFFETAVSERDDVYSVFDVNGFRLGLFAFATQKEAHHFGNNCLLSFSFPAVATLKAKLVSYPVVFPLTKIKSNWVCEIMDSEGNQLELTAPC